MLSSIGRMGVAVRCLVCVSPAPGYRDGGNNRRLGDLTGVGYDGLNRSSAIKGNSGICLYFNSQYLDSGNASICGHGLQLRCLSHPQGVLLAVSTPTKAASTPFYRHSRRNAKHFPSTG
ncbi:hypothetical protein, partial [uncultured Rikenella sp.]